MNRSGPTQEWPPGYLRFCTPVAGAIPVCRLYAVEKISATGFCLIGMNNEVCGITSRRTILTGNYPYLDGEKQPRTSGRTTTATFLKLIFYPVYVTMATWVCKV